MRRIAIVLGLVLVLSIAVSATVFDNLVPSTRALGMGGAYISISNDSNAVFYNPAGLVELNNFHAYAAYKRLYNLDSLQYNTLSFAYSLGKWGTVGLGYQGFTVKIDGEVLETEQTITLSHGFRLMEDNHTALYLGYNINSYSLKFGKDYGSDTALGIDVGIYAKIWKKVILGFVTKNINSPYLGNEFPKDLPKRMVMGVSYEPYRNVITAFELEKKHNENMRLHIGVEFEIIKFLTVRFGSETDPNNLTTGFTLTYSGIGFDYGYMRHPILSETHQFGLSYSF